jgi:hypothetical protein
LLEKKADLISYMNQALNTATAMIAVAKKSSQIYRVRPKILCISRAIKSVFGCVFMVTAGKNRSQAAEFL